MSETVVLDGDDIRRTLARIAHEVVERTGGEDLAVVGIHRRGALLARRLRAAVADLVGEPVPLGDLDISFYRDDVGLRVPGSVRATEPSHAFDAPGSAGALEAPGSAGGLDAPGLAGAPERQPVVHASHLDLVLEEATVVLVDDVLFTGRTVRAAIEALFDYGRPRRVQLAVLADRGHRELPLRPDYVGKNLPTARADRVNVRVEELDGVDEVAIATSVAEVPA